MAKESMMARIARTMKMVREGKNYTDVVRAERENKEYSDSKRAKEEADKKQKDDEAKAAAEEERKKKKAAGMSAGAAYSADADAMLRNIKGK